MASPTRNISTKEALSRQQCLKSLDDFINKCQDDISSMLDTLGWTPEHFMKSKNHVVCPHNSDHRMLKSSLDRHQPLCDLISQGYSKEEAVKITEDTSYFNEKASCVYSVKLDLDTMNSVLWNHHVQNHSVFYGYKKVPQTAEEEQMLMTREDRLGISEYIIKRAKEANRLKELGHDELLVSENLADLIKKDTEERQLDPVEEMAALRDYRRRRQTYRAKNVHITKKSHTEIMREVINNQMEMYTQSLKEEMGLLKPESMDDTGSERERERHRDRSHGSRQDDRSSRRDRRRYSRSRSRSRNTSSRRSFRRSRSRSRDRQRDKHRHGDSRDRRSRDRISLIQEERTNTQPSKNSESETANQSTKDGESVEVTRDEQEDQVKTEESVPQESRSPSGDRSRLKHRKKEKHRTRSRSRSHDRSKKSKHKKHKHKKKHKLEKKQDSEKEDGEVHESDSEQDSGSG